jgi:hypothetical protein
MAQFAINCQGWADLGCEQNEGIDRSSFELS